jgi:Baseplate J-like protein
MAFRVKTFIQIIGDMVAHMRASQRRVTDFNVGSVNRTLLEAAGAEVDELYQAYAQGLLDAIPVAIYRSFDFDTKPALSASGLVRFSATPSHESLVTIPAGFMVAAPGGVQFQVAQQYTIPVGQQTVDALVVCTAPGTAGNVAANTITSLVSSAVDLGSVTNLAAFTNGRGVESEAERKLRFISYIRTLAKGTPEACIYAAKLAQITDPASGLLLERVARCELEETPGHVDMWIHNGAGGTSDALLARAEQLVHGGWTDEQGLVASGYDPTGMRVDVQKMSEITVNASIRVQVPPTLRTAALEAKVKAAVGGAIRGIRSGGTLLPIDMVNAALALRAPVQGAEIVSPLVATPCPLSSVLMPGTVAVAWF